jgi:radical SAM superfamily enzyme YgiQ (UPF0313 family)
MIRQDMVPAREWGGRLPVALVFPEAEPQALSTLGWQSVYQELGYDDGFYVERFFWSDELEKACSPDSDKQLRHFPLICFSLNFEGDFLSLIKILQAENIPASVVERSDWPLIMAGGPIAFLNPFPISPSLDFLYVGESEGRFRITAKVISRSWLSGETRHHALEKISGLPGILVPGRKQRVRKQVSIKKPGLLPSPVHSAFVSPRSVFKDSFLVEINRGCPYGCRFCAAGFIYRPPRVADLNVLKNIIETSSPRKVGLVGTALTDWDHLRPFLDWLYSRKIKFSLSSLRADGLDMDFLKFLRRTGIRTITLAVEGISRTLRTAMNKHFSEDKFFQAVENISRLRFNTLKLYFILGLPGETLDDFHELQYFLERLDQARRSGQGGRNTGVELISISASMFVPKPWTPLQWAPMDRENVFLEKTRRFKKLCAPYKGVRFQAEKPFAAMLQGLLSRGDEKIHDLLILAAGKDVTWRKALKAWPGKIDDYIHRKFSMDKDFVWDLIDIGVEKKYLEKEWARYHKALLTPPCPDQPCTKCGRCGMDKFLG